MGKKKEKPIETPNNSYPYEYQGSDSWTNNLYPYYPTTLDEESMAYIKENFYDCEGWPFPLSSLYYSVDGYSDIWTSPYTIPGYEVETQDKRFKEGKIRVIEKGTCPRFCSDDSYGQRGKLFEGSGDEVSLVRIHRPSYGTLRIYVLYRDGDSKTLEFREKNFYEGVLPKRLIVNLQGAGGAGGYSGDEYGVCGTGGGSGGFLSIVVNIEDMPNGAGVLDIDVPKGGAGGHDVANTGDRGIISYRKWAGFGPFFNEVERIATVYGGECGLSMRFKESVDSGGSGGRVEVKTKYSDYVLLQSRGNAGGGAVYSSSVWSDGLEGKSGNDDPERTIYSSKAFGRNSTSKVYVKTKGGNAGYGAWIFLVGTSAGGGGGASVMGYGGNGGDSRGSSVKGPTVGYRGGGGGGTSSTVQGTGKAGASGGSGYVEIYYPWKQY